MRKGIYEEIVELRSGGKRAALATIIARQGATPRKDSAKMLIYEDGGQSGTIGGGRVEAEVCREARAVMKEGKPKLLTLDLTGIDPEESALVCGGSMDVYVEPIIPDPALFLFGAGHVSKAVAAAARQIGFKIALIDDRAKYANAEWFPDADAYYAESWESALTKLNINISSYVFIATRGHQYDLICLRHAVKASAKYIGMLGSRKKSKILFDLLEQEGLNSAELERVLVPAGIDIGSETPEEIAASIAAELIAVRKNLDVRRLRDALRRANNPAATGGTQAGTGDASI